MTGKLRLTIGAGEQVSDAEYQHRVCAWAGNGRLGLTGAGSCPGGYPGNRSDSGSMSATMNGADLNSMADGAITEEGFGCS